MSRAERTGDARVVHMTSEARKIPYQALNPVYLGRNQGHLGGDGNLLQMMTISGPKWSRYQQVTPSHWRTSFPPVVGEGRTGTRCAPAFPTLARAVHDVARMWTDRPSWLTVSSHTRSRPNWRCGNPSRNPHPRHDGPAHGPATAGTPSRARMHYR
jgi:hypothetical protein